MRVQGLYDKGKGALLRDETRFLDAQGETVAVTISGSYIRGLSGFESKGPPLPALPKPPSRSPDHVREEATSVEQALVYRLSGDYNSLHADPEIAAAVGFDRPILHGLCTFGHAARAVVGAYAQGQPGKLRSITVRPLSPNDPTSRFQDSFVFKSRFQKVYEACSLLYVNASRAHADACIVVRSVLIVCSGAFLQARLPRRNARHDHVDVRRPPRGVPNNGQGEGRHGARWRACGVRRC
jgi:hypothetical protein